MAISESAEEYINNDDRKDFRTYVKEYRINSIN